MTTMPAPFDQAVDILAIEDPPRRTAPVIKLGPREAVPHDGAIASGALSDPPGSPEPDIDEGDDGWSRIDLAEVLAGNHPTPVPTVFPVEGAKALFYPGAVNMIHGDSGHGKSWVAAAAIAVEAKAGRHAMVLDYEDTPVTMTARLQALGVSADVIVETVHYYRPVNPINSFVVDRLVNEIVEFEITLVVVDSVGEAFGVESINEDKDAEVAPWMRRVPRPFADAGAAVLLVDHITKSAENPLHPSGSKRKRAALTGTDFYVEQVKPLGKCEGSEPISGRLRFTTGKDRHGTYQRGKPAAELEVTSWPDGGVTARLWPINPVSADLGLVMAARKTVRVLRDHGKPVSQRLFIGLLKGQLKASTETKRAAIELAVSWGCIALEEGARNAVLHRYVKDPDK